MTVEPLRKILPYTSIAVLIAALYVAYTFYSRKTESDQIDQQMAEKSVEQARDDVARMGGTTVKVTNFYAAPPAVKKGQPVRLCYGVINADSVTLDPPVEKVWPSLSRCFDVSPKQSTTYRLSAIAKEGTASASLTVTVQ